MRRREFIIALGAAAAWPLAARAQQPERMRRIGVLSQYDENDLGAKTSLSAFTQGLAELCWFVGRNLRMDIRWAAGNFDRMRLFAKELVDLRPEAILAGSTPVTAALQRETWTIPIVFLQVSDPIGSGFIIDLSRPGGNITGFMFQEASIVGKLLELLTQIAPSVTRAALMYNPETAPYIESYYLPTFGAAVRSFKMAPIIAPIHNDAEIETAITSLGREPGGGLIGAPDGFIIAHRATIISFAAKNNIPAVYTQSVCVRDGGLLSYGPTQTDVYHRAATYVDRILRGTKPADMPVQLPVKFEMALNVKTAKALGLTVPPSLLATADEVIE